jgi:hypothetical protein
VKENPNEKRYPASSEIFRVFVWKIAHLSSFVSCLFAEDTSATGHRLKAKGSITNTG